MTWVRSIEIALPNLLCYDGFDAGLMLDLQGSLREVKGSLQERLTEVSAQQGELCELLEMS